MDSFSIWHWIAVLMYAVAIGWPLWRIVGRLGRPPALSLALHVPGLGLLVLWWLAFSMEPTVK